MRTVLSLVVVLALVAPVSVHAYGKRLCRLACRDSTRACRTFGFTKKSCNRRLFRNCRVDGPRWCGSTRPRTVTGTMPGDVLSTTATATVTVLPGRVLRVHLVVDPARPGHGDRFVCGYSILQNGALFDVDTVTDRGSCFEVGGGVCDFLLPGAVVDTTIFGCTASIDFAQPFTLYGQLIDTDGMLVP